MSYFLNKIAPRWIKTTMTYSDFTDVGFVRTVNLIALPAKSVVHCTVVSPTTPFTGGTISAYSISVDYQLTGQLLTTASLFTVPSIPIPTTKLPVAGEIGAPMQILVTATSVTGTLNAATAGSADIYLLVSTLE